MIRTQRMVSFLLFILAAAVAATSWAEAPSYTISDVGVVLPATPKACRINESGEVAGTQTTSGGNRAFFKDSAGVIHTLGTLGGTWSQGSAVNSTGEVAGSSYTGSEVHAFTWDVVNGLQDIGTLGRLPCYAYAINDAGQVVGYSAMVVSGSLVNRAFLYNADAMQDLGTLGGKHSNAYGINASGQVVGHSSDSTEDARAFRITPEDTNADGVPDRWYRDDDADGANDLMSNLGTLGTHDGATSSARGINELGEVVGYSPIEISGHRPNRAFVATGPGTMTPLPADSLESGDATYANAINASGEVVGKLGPASGGPSALLWRKENNTYVKYNLNDLIPEGSGWVLQEATDINSSGQIVGYGTINGESHAFLLTPAPSNAQPVAADDSYAVDEDTTLTVAAPGVLANDDDPDNDPLAAILVSDVTNGTLALSADGSFTYTPAPDFNGTDTFTYRASDGELDSEPATVTITVIGASDAPVATDDAYTINEDNTLSVDAPGVLANDNDPDDDPLTAILVSDVANGTLTLNADGSFIYTPFADFNGTDSFTYKANDGSLDSNTATVAITIEAVNDPPVADGDGPYLGIEGEAVPMDGSASIDVETEPLTFIWDFGDDSTLETMEPKIEHTYLSAGIYTVTLVVYDGVLYSGPYTTEAMINATGGGGQKEDIDAFLTYVNPPERKITLAAGTTEYDVTIIYGPTINPDSFFKVTLNGKPFEGFNPVPNTSETVTIPLIPGKKNKLIIKVEGVRVDGRIARDRDKLIFIVPKSP